VNPGYPRGRPVREGICFPVPDYMQVESDDSWKHELETTGIISVADLACDTECRTLYLRPYGEGLPQPEKRSERVRRDMALRRSRLSMIRFLKYVHGYPDYLARRRVQQLVRDHKNEIIDTWLSTHEIPDMP